MKPAFRRQLPKTTRVVRSSGNKYNTNSSEISKSRRFNELNQERLAKLRQRVFKALLIILTGYLIYFLLLSHFFKLEYLIISGNSQTPSQEIEPLVWEALSGRRWLIIPNDNYFSAALGKINTKLSQNFVFNQLTITKQLPKTLLLKIEEKTAQFIWSSNNQYYLMTGDGLIIRELNNYQPQQVIPLIIDQSNASTTVNEVVINSQILSLISQIKENLSLNPIAGIKPNAFQLTNRGSQFIKLKTEAGAEIHLDQTNLNEQLEKLRKIVQSQHLDLSRVEYINLRVTEQAIYRLK